MMQGCSQKVPVDVLRASRNIIVFVLLPLLAFTFPLWFFYQKSEYFRESIRYQVTRVDAREAWTSLSLDFSDQSKNNDSLRTRPKPSKQFQFNNTSELMKDSNIPRTWSKRSQQISSTYNYTLRVPFFVYENELDWSPNAFGNFCRVNKPNQTNRTWFKLIESGYTGYKHSDDFWLLKHALEHPMRTRYPAKAKLFFVPTLLSALSYHMTYVVSKGAQLCVKDKCNEELFKSAEQLLEKSPWFQRSQGRDHIVVDSHFNKAFYEKPSYRNASFWSCNLITFENSRPPIWTDRYQTDGSRRFSVPSFYVGRACPAVPVENKTADFAMIASMHLDRPDFQDRRNICTWLHASNYSVSVCGHGGQCPALGQARYGFHARGDTFGSNRLMDTLLSKSVPLFTHPEQYKILPDLGEGVLPWQDLSYFVNVSSRASFEGSLKSLLSKSDDEYQQMQQNIAHYQHILDHRQGGQFDAYMTHFAKLLDIQ